MTDTLGTNKKPVTKHAMLFGIGCLFGLLCFFIIYGVRVLDVTYDAWLMNGDMDLSQHYNGWLHYRMDDWRFPFGLIDSLSEPYSVSVLYTDSVPIFAVFFKLFRNLLPTTFQYFGIYGALCFMLQGGLSTLLLAKFSEKKWFCILGGLLFTINFPLVHRMYYHTALASHWIIILALNIWFGANKAWLYESRRIVKLCIIWGLMGALCVFVHSYYLPMAGAILLASIIDGGFRSKEAATSAGVIKCKKTFLFGGICEITAFCLSALISLYTLGGFYGEGAGIGEGIGSFTSNLNTFFNSLGHGSFGLNFPLYYEFQYEGFGYLGMGLLMLLLLCICLWMCSIIFLYICTGEERKYIKSGIIRGYALNHPSRFSAILIFLIMQGFATLPMVCANGTKLFGVPLPGFIKNVWNIFRSNGRFIWVPMYLLILAMLVFVEKNTNEKLLTVLLAIVLVFQIADISKFAEEKREYFAAKQVFESIYDDEMDAFIGDKKHFVFLYNENDIIMDTARYAYFKSMNLSNFYYARDIDEQIDKTIAENLELIGNGDLENDVVYVFREEDYDAVYDGMGESLRKNGHVFVVKSLLRK